MRFDWDIRKSELNRILRGKGFDEAAALFVNTHHLRTSVRNGQRRWEVWGYLDGKEWLGVFEFAYNGALRVVSLRRANSREKRKYYV